MGKRYKEQQQEEQDQVRQKNDERAKMFRENPDLLVPQVKEGILGYYCLLCYGPNRNGKTFFTTQDTYRMHLKIKHEYLEIVNYLIEHTVREPFKKENNTEEISEI